MHERTIDMTGRRIGKLLVVGISDRKGKGTYWICQCDCGKTKTMRGYVLRKGWATGCGCNRVQSHFKHGHARVKRITGEYSSWCGMKQRCYDPSSNRYYAYGARGIGICERWLNSFEAFLLDMGPKPTPEHSIDRIDVDGNYEPGNCRWATRSEQARNTRRHKRSDALRVAPKAVESSELTAVTR